jgi:hypothetical protein
MSDQIEFKFKGTPEQLSRMIAALALETYPVPLPLPVTGSYAPQPVSSQQPPPPAPPLTPDNPGQPPHGYKEGYIQGDVPDSMMPHGAGKADAPTREKLTVDPMGQAPGSSIERPGGLEASTPPLPAPGAQNYPSGFDFGSLALHEEAWAEFVGFTEKWVVNFDSPLDEDGNAVEEQPDRLLLLKGLSNSRWSLFVLRWFGHFGSLQGALHKALSDLGRDDDIDFIDRVSANITQVSHAAFPDIAGFHDYSTKWKRVLQEGGE